MVKFQSTNKAQMWFSDFIIGLVIFTIALTIFFGYFFNIFNLQENDLNKVLDDVKIISNFIVGTGSPEDWTSNNVQIIGLSDSKKGIF